MFPGASRHGAVGPGTVTSVAAALLATLLILVAGCDKHGLTTQPLESQTYTLSAAGSGTGSGTVTSNPVGISCAIASATASGECSRGYGAGTRVALAATPGTGSAFVSWGGACAGTGSCQLEMSQARTVTATFNMLPPSQFALTITRAGRGNGTISSTPAGITCGAACNASFDSATVVTLAATPGTGSVFAGWRGACTGTGNCQVTMGQARSVTATWDIVQFALTVAKAGTGSGSVTSSPDGLSCGATCSVPFDTGSVVTLTATPGTGSVFAGWSGACTGTGNCQVTMSQARNVTATWNVKQFALTMATTGAGAGSVSTGPGGVGCGTACSVLYDSGTVVTLTAAPGTGSVFTGWTGACTGTGSCQVTMSQARAVTATFNAAPPTQFTLAVIRAGAGGGSVGSTPLGIACGAACSASFDSGTVVTLTATAGAGAVFAGWSGACTGADACQVTMSRARAVTAAFRAAPASRFALTITEQGTGSGTVTSTPDGIICGAACDPSFDSSTVVTLTATPGTGSEFEGWGGACAGTGSCQVTMSQARNVTAFFNTAYYRLTIHVGGTGSGTVTSSPSGISCTFIHGTAAGGCTGVFPFGATVSLNPVAFDGNGFGGWSGACAGTQACLVSVPRDTSVTAGFTLLAPATPTGLAVVSRTASSLVISWRRSSEADLYYLLRASTSGGTYTSVHSGRDTLVTDAGLASSTAYYYLVRAWNNAGWSSFSAELAGTTSPGIPSVPNGLAVGNPTATSLAVSWSASPQATLYQLLRSPSAGGTYSEVYKGTGTSITDPGLAGGTTYYYRVKAFNGYGYSDASDARSGTTLSGSSAAPAVPTGLTVGNPTATSLDVSWNASAQATGYQLLRSPSAGGTYSEVYKGTGTSVTDPGLAGGTTYYYRVKAYNTYGYSDASDYKSGTTLSGSSAAPAVPTGLTVGNPTATSLAVSWNATPRATGYQLLRSSTAGGTYGEVYRGPGTSITDPSLAAGTTYYYKVRAFNNAGSSDLSDYASGTTLAANTYESAYLRAVFGRGGFYWTTNVAKWQSGTIWIRYSDLMGHHIASPSWSKCYDAVLVLDPHDHDDDGGRPATSGHDGRDSQDGRSSSDNDRRDDDGRSGSAFDRDRRDDDGRSNPPFGQARLDDDDGPSFFFSEHAPRSDMGLDLDPSTTSVTVAITGVLEHRDPHGPPGRFWSRGGAWNGRFDFDPQNADCQTLTRTIPVQSLPGGAPYRIDIGYWYSDPRFRWGAGIREVTLTFNGWLVPAGQDATVWRCTGTFNWNGNRDHAYPRGYRDRACDFRR